MNEERTHFKVDPPRPRDLSSPGILTCHSAAEKDGSGPLRLVCRREVRHYDGHSNESS